MRPVVCSNAGATRGTEVGPNPTFNPAGLGTTTKTIGLKVRDDDGGISATVPATINILGQGTAIVSGVLNVVGKDNANDVVSITKVGTKIQVIATFQNNNPLQFNSAGVTSIEVRMRGGNDVVVVAPNITLPLFVDGGAGNDVLTAGGGNSMVFGGTGNDVVIGGPGDNILVGGDGNDVILGAAGRDLIVGGRNSDVLGGGGGEDILIGGWTIHDTNRAALDAIMAVWSSSASFNNRVATLVGAGGLLSGSVFDDDASDILDGGGGRDLIFGDNSLLDGVVDAVVMQVMQDVLVPVT